MNFRQFDAIIDTRSPAEYAEDHIPGAISAPVLDDAERAQIGTLHKQVSPFDARKIGASLIARNVARHVEQLFQGHARTWRPLVYCWRGGKRSGAMAHILREIGWNADTLKGGYKAYRKWVVTQLEVLPSSLEFVVIHGPTGSGKSRLLAALKRAGAQVLDLEDLAAHRGSVLGNLPGRPQPSQKMFESLLLSSMSEFQPSRPVYVEGESKKIGQLQVPEALMARMRASPCVVLETSLEARIDLLLDEYRHFLEDRALLDAQLDCLVALHGRERIAEWKSIQDWRELVARLLVQHYDPAYHRSSARNFAHLADARNLRITSATDAAFATAANTLVDRTAIAA